MGACTETVECHAISHLCKTAANGGALWRLEVPKPPPGVSLIPWSADLLEAHAEVKWLSFRDTLDASIFPNLGRLNGCLQLMQTIAWHEGFVPEATWLARRGRGIAAAFKESEAAAGSA